MNRLTLLLVIVAAILFGLWFTANDDGDATLLRDLARKEASETIGSLESSRPDLHPTFWDLTDQVKASKNAGRETWFATSDVTDSKIQMPFPPDPRGVFPASSSNAVAVSGDDGPGYMGADACRECHQQRHESFSHTGHYLASATVNTQAIDSNVIRGHWESPQNRLQPGDPLLEFAIRRQGDGLVQRVSFVDWNIEIPMDLVTGSAKTGQTYLYWVDNALFQAHVSYLADSDEWVTSPGYSQTSVDFSRPIKTICLECHVTYVRQIRPPNHYDRDSLIPGISCERCHGPGREHVEYHRNHPTVSVAEFIARPAELSRERQLDLCGQCHSGMFKILGEPFAYRPGQDLRSHHEPENTDSNGAGGIHTSNQMSRLRMSECFKQSEMTCTTCHDPHQNQRGNNDWFNQACLQCHESQHCGKAETLGPGIVDRCTECHMPVSANSDIQMEGSRGRFIMPMADHYIRVVDEAGENR